LSEAGPRDHVAQFYRAFDDGDIEAALMLFDEGLETIDLGWERSTG
jgi:hypothetical protein